MKSMTGYGRATATDGRHEVEIQISSVNRRHNEVLVRLPRESGAIEPLVRRFFSSRMCRGQITVTVVVRDCLGGEIVPVDMVKVERDIELLKTMAEHLSCEALVELALLEIWKGRADFEKSGDEAHLSSLVEKGLDEAFELFDANRLSEGCHIEREIEERLNRLRDIRSSIVTYLDGQVAGIRGRLKELLDQLVPSLQNDERVLREVVLYADRADVSEELSRIDHHLRHVEEELEKGTASGKLLEFVLQELLREWNTLGAKTTSSEASTCVVLAKMELEKIREQVQNVE